MRVTLHVSGDHSPEDIVEALIDLGEADMRMDILTPALREAFQDIRNAATVAMYREQMNRDARSEMPF